MLIALAALLAGLIAGFLVARRHYAYGCSFAGTIAAAPRRSPALAPWLDS